MVQILVTQQGNGGSGIVLAAEKRDFLSRPFNGHFLCYLSLSLSLFLFALSFLSLLCLICIPFASTGPVYSWYSFL